jgi:hypothetical protein
MVAQKYHLSGVLDLTALAALAARMVTLMGLDEAR